MRIFIILAGLTFFGVSLFFAHRVFLEWVIYPTWDTYTASITSIQRSPRRKSTTIYYQYSINGRSYRDYETIDRITSIFNVYGYKQIQIKVNPKDPDDSVIPVFPWMEIVGAFFFIPFGAVLISKALKEEQLR